MNNYNMLHVPLTPLKRPNPDLYVSDNSMMSDNSNTSVPPPNPSTLSLGADQSIQSVNDNMNTSEFQSLEEQLDALLNSSDVTNSQEQVHKHVAPLNAQLQLAAARVLPTVEIAASLSSIQSGSDSTHLVQPQTFGAAVTLPTPLLLAHALDTLVAPIAISVSTSTSVSRLSELTIRGMANALGNAIQRSQTTQHKPEVLVQRDMQTACVSLQRVLIKLLDSGQCIE
jgi:hypothetical protein